MNKLETMSLLREWHEHHEIITEITFRLVSAVGMAEDSPVYLTIWKLFDDYTKKIVMLIGDDEEWLEWYRSETAMGQVGKKVKINGKTKKIKTLEQLCNVIIEARR